VIRIDTSGDLHGSWDAARISQVLANLLGNAVQHGLSSEPITVTVQGEAKDVVLAVHNRGPTIPRSEIPRLFDPVKRLRRGEAPTSDAGNLGLGLYIAERIVIAHGGSIEVDSSDEKGTRFTIRLPR
jgi:signal transduction histidine kinase